MFIFYMDNISKRLHNNPITYKGSDQTMKRFLIGCLATLIISGGFIGMSPQIHAEGINTNITLTKQQKEEMAILQKNALNQKIGIINKYVEYGVFTEEKGEKIITHMEEYYEKLEDNGFIPKWDKKKCKHKHNE